MIDHLPLRFGRYELTALVGEGGMAEVYKASVEVAEGLSKWVVIKRIRPEYANRREFTRMFVEEAKIALSLNHANIVQVFDFGQVDGVFYLAMELIEGTDLMKLFHAVRESGAAFSDVVTAFIGHQIASGLAYAHRKVDDFGNPLQIVHRDVSPHNVMLSLEGQVKVLDFGIARTRNPDGPTLDPRDEEASIKGKIAYMSPEQALGRGIDARSDIFSLGVVLYELLTGTLLHRMKDRLAALEKVRNEPIPPILSRAPELPDELAAIVDRALAREPSARYQTAREIQADLAAFLHRSDPIVDDEYLQRFLSKFYTSAPPRHELDAIASEATRAFLEGEDSVWRNPEVPSPPRRVAVLAVSLKSQDAASDIGPFLNLVKDIAFKREAHLHRCDRDGLVLVFGTVLPSSEDTDRALRVGRTLREVIGDAAPGFAIGTVVLETHARVVRHPQEAPRVMLSDELVTAMIKCAHRFLDNHVVAAGAAIDRLSDSWRVGEADLPANTDSDSANGEAWGIELQQLAPVLGPKRSAENYAAPLTGGASSFFGRELELKALRDAFRETVRSGVARSLVVEGQAGLGKRTLIEHFVTSLPRGSCAVFRGVGRWNARNEPFGAFWSMLQRFLMIDEKTQPEEVVQKLTDYGVVDAGPLVQILGGALGVRVSEEVGVTPETFRDLSARLIRRLIRSVARRRPALVVVENLEFVDQESLDVLKWWSLQRAEFPIFGLVSGRSGARVDQLTGDSDMQVVHLQEFDERARRDFILGRFEDRDEAESLTDSILASTGGHPLFIEEMLATLLNRGVVTWNDSGRKLSVVERDVPLKLPPSIEHALMNRVDELEPSHRDVLVGGAILGRTFRLDEVEILMERDVVPALEEALERGFLERENSSSNPSFTFSTISFHEICKSRLQEIRARELHRRAAELKLDRSDYADGRDDGAIADHMVAAGSHFEAVGPALRAANHALRMAGNVEAHYYLTLALGGMTPNDPRRFDALLDRERVLRAWGRRRPQGADIRELISIAERLETPALEVRAAIRLLRFYLECGRASRAAMLAPRIEERIVLLDAPAPYLAALRELQSELSFSDGELERASEHAQDGISICEAHALDGPQRCRLIACVGKIHSARGRLPMARKAFESMLELARLSRSPRLEAEALNSLGGVAGRNTDYQAAVDFFRASIAIDRDLGDRATTGIKLANLGITFAAIGLYRRSERYLRKALELHETSGHAGLLNDAVIHLGEVVGELHDLEGAEAILSEASTVAHELDDVRSELRAKNRHAKIILHWGIPERFAEAESLATEVYQRASRRGRPLRSAACRALQVLAAISDRDGHHNAAIMLAREATILVRAGAAPVDGVLAIHHMGVLLTRAGRSEEGERLLSEAGRAVMRRLEGLRDPVLREGYLGQAAVSRVLHDAGISTPR